MPNMRQSIGRWGEDQAAQYLMGLGYTILERNAQTPYGEIDLVTILEGETIFVEVKTRRTKSFGWPEEAITSRKRANLIAAAQAYLLENPHLDGNWRIDVVAITRFRGDQQPQIIHYDDAIY